MESYATDPSLWGWIRSLAEGHMVIAVAVWVIGIVFGVAFLAVGINLIGTQVLGRNDRLTPAVVKWSAQMVVRLAPILSDRLRQYVVHAERPTRPPNKKRRILAAIAMGVYLIGFWGVLWVTYGPNVVLAGYDTSLGGVLVEVRARREPTDGLQFDIQFDRPAKVTGVWEDVPTSKRSTREFSIRYGELVGFDDEQTGLVHTITARYPIATPGRSVFVYFQPIEQLDSRQLKVTSIKWHSE